MKGNKCDLECLVEQKPDPCPKDSHWHPHEFIANHVLLVAFISVMFLVGTFMFMLSVPSEDQATAYALIEFGEIDFNFIHSLSDVKDVLLDQSHRTEFLYIVYISWILIVGVINLYMVEREHKKFMKKK